MIKEYLTKYISLGTWLGGFSLGLATGTIITRGIRSGIEIFLIAYLALILMRIFWTVLATYFPKKKKRIGEIKW